MTTDNTESKSAIIQERVWNKLVAITLPMEIMVSKEGIKANKEAVDGLAERFMKNLKERGSLTFTAFHASADMFAYNDPELLKQLEFYVDYQHEVVYDLITKEHSGKPITNFSNVFPIVKHLVAYVNKNHPELMMRQTEKQSLEKGDILLYPFAKEIEQEQMTLNPHGQNNEEEPKDIVRFHYAKVLTVSGEQADRPISFTYQAFPRVQQDTEDDSV